MAETYFCQVGWLVDWLEFKVPFQHKYGYIRDKFFCQDGLNHGQNGLNHCLNRWCQKLDSPGCDPCWASICVFPAVESTESDSPMSVQLTSQTRAKADDINFAGQRTLSQQLQCWYSLISFIFAGGAEAQLRVGGKLYIKFSIGNITFLFYTSVYIPVVLTCSTWLCLSLSNSAPELLCLFLYILVSWS